MRILGTCEICGKHRWIFSHSETAYDGLCIDCNLKVEDAERMNGSKVSASGFVGAFFSKEIGNKVFKWYCDTFGV